MGSQLTYDPLELQFQYKTQTKQVLDEKKKAGFFWRKPGTNTTELNDTQISTQLAENTKKIMASSSLESLSKNQQTFEALLLAKNAITLDSLRDCAGISIIGVDQDNTVEFRSDIDMVRDVQTAMKVSMSSSFTDSICDKKSVGGSTLEGVTGKIVDGATKMVDTSVNALAAVLGASSKTKVDKTTISHVKDIVKTTVDTYLDAKLSETNIQTAKNSAQALNDITLKNLNCGGPVNIRDITQTNVVSMFLSILFESTVEYDLENKMLNDIKTAIERDYTESGDIQDIGDALADNILAVGAAAKDVGAGIAAAITPVTNLGEALGDDAAGAAETAMLAMIAPAIAIIIVVGVVMYSQSKGGKKTNNA